ncbi:MAG TPA: class I SAM-dependent methyltransferase, partial [Verrucomicrobiae bacterium]|nr:class I SAM-dependent methyltransferase [Verrucomicrobiae bacterium]
GHDFVFGDAFDWFRRLKKKGKRYDVIVLDPPTFSQSRESGVFRAERDYGKLVESAVPLLSSGGVLFASTNAGSWSVEAFLTAIEGAVVASRRRVLRRHYFPQPPDFPISHPEPAYLKTLWIQLE